jgi:hypothetical protein
MLLECPRRGWIPGAGLIEADRGGQPMQNQPSKPLHKSYRFFSFGKEFPVTEALARVEDALILHPKMPAVQLAEILIENADDDTATALRIILERQFYLHAIRSYRIKQAAKNRAQLLLPGFEHLPVTIPSPKGIEIKLLDANTHAVRQYYRSLMKEHRERKLADPRIKEALALLQKMEAASHTEKRITVRQVLLLER